MLQSVQCACAAAGSAADEFPQEAQRANKIIQDQADSLAAAMSKELEISAADIRWGMGQASGLPIMYTAALHMKPITAVHLELLRDLVCRSCPGVLVQHPAWVCCHSSTCVIMQHMERHPTGQVRGSQCCHVAYLPDVLADLLAPQWQL